MLGTAVHLSQDFKRFFIKVNCSCCNLFLTIL